MLPARTVQDPGPRKKWERRERSPSVYEKGTIPLFRMGECPFPRFPRPCPKGKDLGWAREAPLAYSRFFTGICQGPGDGYQILFCQ